MITGDHPVTAQVIPHELGIKDNDRTVSGAELQAASDDELAELVKTVSVYARVPEQTLRIIGALQKQGAVVAMTGDGVNDAPALKTAYRCCHGHHRLGRLETGWRYGAGG